MSTFSIIVIILLVVIAYILWRIYRQREDEKEEIANEKSEVERKQAKKERFKNYPHLFGELEESYLAVFAMDAENGTPLLKLAFLLYLQESTKIDFSPGSFKWDTFWKLTEELLEHLEKFHEGSIVEHEIAVAIYWQMAAEAVGELIKESPDKTTTQSGREIAPIEGKKLEVEPYTNIEKIVSLFPKKANHPAEEISFSDEKGIFPRESKGSAHIHEKLKALGL
jgi:hypothetical protein